jgi:hypothetical protein
MPKVIDVLRYMAKRPGDDFEIEVLKNVFGLDVQFLRYHLRHQASMGRLYKRGPDKWRISSAGIEWLKVREDSVG